MTQVWLITGSSRGLDRALAEAVLSAGGKLVATARDPERLADLSKRHARQVRPFVLDVTDPHAAGDAGPGQGNGTARHQDHDHRTNGAQPGDPAKTAAAILQVASLDEPPLRLLLGSDAFASWKRPTSPGSRRTGNGAP